MKKNPLQVCKILCPCQLEVSKKNSTAKGLRIRRVLIVDSYQNAGSNIQLFKQFSGGDIPGSPLSAEKPNLALNTKTLSIPALVV